MKLHPRTFSEGSTQSEITTFDVCPVKWYYHYNLLLSGGDANIDFAIGTAWHKIMAGIYTPESGEDWREVKCQYEEGAEKNQEHEALLEQWDKILQVYAERYIIKYKDEIANLQVLGVEQEIDVTIPWKGTEIRLRGVVDLRGKLLGKMMLFDHKTTSGLNSALMRGWEYRFQFMFYLWLARQVLSDMPDRLIINVMVKPTIRIKQTESLGAYLGRLRKEIIDDPNKYFYRQPLILTKGKMERFEQEVLFPKFDRIAMMQESTKSVEECGAQVLDTLEEIIPSFMGANTHSCIQFGKFCPFLGVCEGKQDVNKLHVRKIKHPEILCQ